MDFPPLLFCPGSPPPVAFPSNLFAFSLSTQVSSPVNPANFLFLIVLVGSSVLWGLVSFSARQPSTTSDEAVSGPPLPPSFRSEIPGFLRSHPASHGAFSFLHAEPFLLNPVGVVREAVSALGVFFTSFLILLFAAVCVFLRFRAAIFVAIDCGPPLHFFFLSPSSQSFYPAFCSDCPRFVVFPAFGLVCPNFPASLHHFPDCSLLVSF